MERDIVIVQIRLKTILPEVIVLQPRISQPICEDRRISTNELNALTTT